VDGQRFDALSRRLAGRLSRRSALGRGGGGLAALVGAASGLGAAGRAAARQAAAGRYVVVRTYQPSGSLDDLRRALSRGYAPLLARQPGFVEYLVFGSGGLVVSVTVFDDQPSEEAATSSVAAWVGQNLAPLLPSPGQTLAGATIAQAANTAAYCPASPADPTAVQPAPTAPVVPPTQAPAPPTATAVPGQPTPTALPVCTDPSRPGVGCACQTGTQDPCGDAALLCCADDPDGPPGGPGTCAPSSVGCQPLGPTPTPVPAPPCSGQGCRCNGGVQGACDGGLVCCPDNPGLPGGPGRCVPGDQCNPPQGCTSEGCSCHTGVAGACDGGLVCCADDSSQPGGPGRCEAESVCFANQCQATTNPCPSSCAAGGHCAACCSGWCGGDGACGAPPCAGVGCECTAGVAGACDPGLVCCQSQMGGGPVPGGPGLCATPDGCGGGAPAAGGGTTAAPEATEPPAAAPAPDGAAAPDEAATEPAEPPAVEASDGADATEDTPADAPDAPDAPDAAEGADAPEDAAGADETPEP
jgi:hypothetical protein